MTNYYHNLSTIIITTSIHLTTSGLWLAVLEFYRALHCYRAFLLFVTMVIDTAFPPQVGEETNQAYANIINYLSRIRHAGALQGCHGYGVIPAPN